MTNGKVTQYQIKDLEKDVDSLKVDVKKILENDLPHLKGDVSEVKNSLKLIIGLIVAIFLMLIGLVMEHVF